MYNLIGLLISFFFFSACNNEANTEPTKQDNTRTVVQDTVPPVKPVSDTDEHGCMTAAGQQWSKVRQSCIQLTETGIKMIPKDPSLDKSKLAYLVFSDDRVRVEIFLPTQTKSIVIRKTSAANDPERWSSGPLTLLLADGMYSLDDEGKLLYQGGGK